MWVVRTVIVTLIEVLITADQDLGVSDLGGIILVIWLVEQEDRNRGADGVEAVNTHHIAVKRLQRFSERVLKGVEFANLVVQLLRQVIVEISTYMIARVTVEDRDQIIILGLND